MRNVRRLEKQDSEKPLGKIEPALMRTLPVRNAQAVKAKNLRYYGKAK